MHHRYEHAAWTWTCSIDVDMEDIQHSVDMDNLDMQYGLDIQYGQRLAAWRWTGSMEVEIQHGG